MDSLKLKIFKQVRITASLFFIYWLWHSLGTKIVVGTDLCSHTEDNNYIEALCLFCLQ